MPAYADVSAVEHQLIVACLRRVASVRPAVAIVMAEALVPNERELDSLASLLEPEDADLALRLLGEVLEAAGGQA